MDPLSPSNINPTWSTSPVPPSRPLPTSSSSSSSFREPKIFGAPGLGLVSPPAESSSQAADASNVNGDGSGSKEKEKLGPFLRVRIGGLERNRKDLLIRFDASVSLCSACSIVSQGREGGPVCGRSDAGLDQFASISDVVIPEYATVQCGVSTIR